MTRFNFSPVSSAQSSLLRFAAGYSLLNGVIYGVLAAMVLVGLFLGETAPAPTVVVALGVIVLGVIWRELK